MRLLAGVGIVLLVVGVVSLAYGGLPYRQKQTEVQVGPLKVTAEEKRSFPIPPVGGWILVGSGLILLVVGLQGRR